MEPAIIHWTAKARAAIFFIKSGCRMFFQQIGMAERTLAVS
jgi:hypothetical protein